MRNGKAALVALVLAALGLLWLLTPPPKEPDAAADSASLGLLLLDREGGVYILAVSDGSAADRAGLQPGDRILSVGEQPLTDAAAFNPGLPEGTSVPLRIRRNGLEMNLTLPLR